MAKANIILTGFMGTGKSTVGRLLARQLGYTFVDTDALIQERAGQSIPDIFRDQGEAVFRAMEASIALELGGKQGLVIATGGRMMLEPANAAALGRTGRVFCLVATAEEIMARVSADPGVKRPLLAASDPMARIVELMRRREEGYSRFTQITTSEKTPQQIARYLIDLYQAFQD